MKLVFATNNSHKFHEIRSLVPESYELLSLGEIGCTDEPPETHDTLMQNAIEKADYIFIRYGFPCFADDSGLEVDALDGKPGVYSARYAGTAGNSANNIKKLLHEMKDMTNRKARFKTVIAYIKDAKPVLFEGTVEGEILHEIAGNEGFGYDPVFKPIVQIFLLHKCRYQLEQRAHEQAEAEMAPRAAAAGERGRFFAIKGDGN